MLWGSCMGRTWRQQPPENGIERHDTPSGRDGNWADCSEATPGILLWIFWIPIRQDSELGWFRSETSWMVILVIIYLNWAIVAHGVWSNNSMKTSSFPKDPKIQHGIWEMAWEDGGKGNGEEWADAHHHHHPLGRENGTLDIPAGLRPQQQVWSFFWKWVSLAKNLKNSSSSKVHLVQPPVSHSGQSDVPPEKPQIRAGAKAAALLR